jgi:hypothetical protein
MGEWMGLVCVGGHDGQFCISMVHHGSGIQRHQFGCRECTQMKATSWQHLYSVCRSVCTQICDDMVRRPILTSAYTANKHINTAHSCIDSEMQQRQKRFENIINDIDQLLDQCSDQVHQQLTTPVDLMQQPAAAPPLPVAPPSPFEVDLGNLPSIPPAATSQHHQHITPKPTQSRPYPTSPIPYERRLIDLDNPDWEHPNINWMAVLQYNYQLVQTTPPDFVRIEDRTVHNNWTFKFRLDLSVFKPLLQSAHEQELLTNPAFGCASSIKEAKRLASLDACKRLYQLNLLRKPIKVMLVDQLTVLGLEVLFTIVSVAIAAAAGAMQCNAMQLSNHCRHIDS